MKETLESFGVVVQTTNGVALLVAIPLLPAYVTFMVARAAFTSLRSKFQKHADLKWAEQVLASPPTPGDELVRQVAADTIRLRAL